MDVVAVFGKVLFYHYSCLIDHSLINLMENRLAGYRYMLLSTFGDCVCTCIDFHTVRCIICLFVLIFL